MQAEMKILKLEGENAAQRAVLRRREEEKAAVQRRTRDVALLSAAAGRAAASRQQIKPMFGCHSCAAAKDRSVGGSKERADTKALAQKVDRFRLRRWKMLLERELELHSRRHEEAQSIGRDEMALNKLKKTLEELCGQRDKLQLLLSRAAPDAEGECDGDGAERLQEVGVRGFFIGVWGCFFEAHVQVEDAIDAADAQAEYAAQPAVYYRLSVLFLIVR